MAAGRILAVDPGRIRVGLALSDPSGIIAQGLPTLASGGLRRDVESIAKLAQEREVVEIVVGCPKNLDGSDGTMSEPARRLASALGARTGLPVALWDERLTSAQAERALIEGGVRRERRRQSRDQVAATLILQGFLDRRATGEPE